MHAVRDVVILGGGSAGWIAAALLAAEFRVSRPEVRVTLIESPDLPIIGVGEGTWPSMRATLHDIGLRESDLVRECDAAFKQGSRFDGWVDGSAADRYYHPFSLPHGFGDTELAGGWLQTQPDRSFADCVGPQPQLCDDSLAPKQVTSAEYGGAANYGYHFDAVKMGQMIRRHAVDKLGVRHITDHVLAVRSHDNGDIAALATRGHGDVTGDLFIDCSGQTSLLLGQHYGVALLSQQSVLFNDTALAVQVPYARPDAALASVTIATAHAEGWTWDIGLPTRRGVGLVYSSAHTSDDAAEKALQKHLASSGAPAGEHTPRRIRFNPGYREHFWHRNCVAVGLSAGFIEPLEASALALVELSVAMIRDDFPADRAEMGVVATRFNEAFAYRWARIIEFLKLHYVLSKRNDADYWRDHRSASTQPERLQELLQLWRHRAPNRHDFNRLEEVFPAASYQYVLYGMGFKPELAALNPQRLAAAQASMREAATITKRLLGGLPPHRDLINHLRAQASPAA